MKNKGLKVIAIVLSIAAAAMVARCVFITSSNQPITASTEQDQGEPDDSWRSCVTGPEYDRTMRIIEMYLYSQGAQKVAFCNQDWGKPVVSINPDGTYGVDGSVQIIVIENRQPMTYVFDFNCGVDPRTSTVESFNIGEVIGPLTQEDVAEYNRRVSQI